MPLRRRGGGGDQDPRDPRSAGQGSQKHLGRHGPTAPDRHEFPDRHAIACDDVGLAAVEPAHDFAALVSQRSLGDDLCHRATVAHVLQRPPGDTAIRAQVVVFASLDPAIRAQMVVG